MSKLELPASFKGKYPGVFILVMVQGAVGAIHVVSGLVLLFSPSMLPLPIPYIDVVYGLYTFLYGLLTAIFAYGLWVGKEWGWTGTIIISIIVVVMDLFTILNLPLIAGVPKFAGAGEIPYSLVVVIYLIQPNIRRIFTEAK